MRSLKSMLKAGYIGMCVCVCILRPCACVCLTYIFMFSFPGCFTADVCLCVRDPCGDGRSGLGDVLLKSNHSCFFGPIFPRGIIRLRLET